MHTRTFTHALAPRLDRGPGLAYGSRLVCKCDEGMMYFVTYRATHVVEAFRAAANAIGTRPCVAHSFFFFFGVWLLERRSAVFEGWAG